MTDIATIAAKVPQSLKDALTDLAHERRTTVSAIIIAAVKRELEDEL